LHLSPPPNPLWRGGIFAPFPHKIGKGWGWGMFLRDSSLSITHVIITCLADGGKCKTHIYELCMMMIRKFATDSKRVYNYDNAMIK
jgi:hypothetical protein